MEEEYQYINAAAEMIKEAFGIDLEWGEKALLKQYFLSEGKSYGSSVLREFMLDVFDLDILELGPGRGYTLNLETGTYDPIISGSNWLRDERFIRHCRESVDRWRQERKLG